MPPRPLRAIAILVAFIIVGTLAAALPQPAGAQIRFFDNGGIGINPPSTNPHSYPQVGCLPPRELWNGVCVDKCPPGQVHKQPNGACDHSLSFRERSGLSAVWRCILPRGAVRAFPSCPAPAGAQPGSSCQCLVPNGSTYVDGVVK